MSAINERISVKSSDSIRMVQLIVDPGNAGWILEKIAVRLKEKFQLGGIDVQILDCPNGDSDVVYWLYFGHRGIIDRDLDKYSTRLKSALVTHVDDAAKVNRVKKLHKVGVDLVFMSPAHSLEISSMLGFSKPFFNILLGTDLVEVKRRMKIGIFSKCFSDGRKNEGWLVELAKKENLEECEFIFIGTGWDGIRDKLEASGAQVNLYDGVQHPYPEYSKFPSFYRSLDLYLYAGFDEGAMGSLDAYVLGVKLLISRQGFHKEFDLDDTSFFSNYQEFHEKFMRNLVEYRNHQRTLEAWSWGKCADSLLEHWTQVLQPSSASITTQESDDNSQFLTKWKKNYRRTYFIFIFRRTTRFINIRLRNWIIRKYKSRFYS